MPPDSVLVRWLPVAGIAEADWLALSALLPEEEQARARRFHFRRDWESYTAAHALLRGTLTLLAMEAGHPVAPLDWRFSVGDHGKPEPVLPPGVPPFRVNLSHTRGLAAVAVALDRAVGVDVEWLDRTNLTIDLADRFFAPAECAQLVGLRAEAEKDALFAFWTLKEAYVKAIGKGLSQPLDAFAFSLEPPVIRFDDIEADDAALWRFRHLRPTDRHKLAVGVRHPHPERLSMEIGAAPLDYLRNLGAASSSSA
jgi:4'-phosphopantetheinyl transferase